MSSSLISISTTGPLSLGDAVGGSNCTASSMLSSESCSSISDTRREATLIVSENCNVRTLESMSMMNDCSCGLVVSSVNILIDAGSMTSTTSL